MRSTFGGLNTVVLGLLAQQVSLDTVGHNISNANTDGYSRQRANLVTSRPQTIYTGCNGTAQIGTGVLVESITRARNTFVDQQYWKESSTLGYSESLSENLSKIEGVFMEPSETGLQTTLDNFWKSWQSMGTNSSDTGMRTVVRERGVEVVNAIQKAEQQLRDMVADANSAVEIKTNKINELTQQIYDLNRQIVSVEVGGADHANDLRDTRDYLTDQLSKLAKITVSEEPSGAFTIQSAGVTLVSQTNRQTLETYDEVDPTYGYVTKKVQTTGGAAKFEPASGELKALIEGRDSEEFGVKAYLNKLNTASQFLLTEFNAQHLQAYGLDNTNGTNFFGASNTYYTNETIDLATAQVTYPGMTKVYGEDVVGANSEKPTKYNNWLDQLQVNPALFNETNGLDKIAAKTKPVANQDTISIQQSNKNAGKGTFGTTSYSSAEARTYIFKITGIDSSGNALKVQYSTNGGSSWSSDITAAPAGSGVFTSTDGFSTQLTIAASTGNMVNDTYTFTIGQNNAAGDNAVNMANMLKKTISPLLGNTTLYSYYSAAIGALGVQSQNAENATVNQTTLVGQVTNWRESVAGVNMDEEMSNMIRFQKGYNAAARVLTTMDEMLDKLINGTGVVGR